MARTRQVRSHPKPAIPHRSSCVLLLLMLASRIDRPRTANVCSSKRSSRSPVRARLLALLPPQSYYCCTYISLSPSLSLLLSSSVGHSHWELETLIIILIIICIYTARSVRSEERKTGTETLQDRVVAYADSSHPSRFVQLYLLYNEAKEE